MGYHSAVQMSTFESVPMKWMNREPVIQSGISQKEKNNYCELMRARGERWCG